MAKIFVFDIDGTLLNGKRHLTERVVSEINEIKKKGCKFTIATGRSPLWTIPILEELEVRIPYISAGGACVIDYIQNKLIIKNEIDKTSLNKLLELAYKKNINGLSFPNLHEVVADIGAYNTMKPLIGDLPLKRQNSLLDYKSETLKVDILGDIQVLKELSYEIAGQIPSLYVAGAGTTCLEITQAGTDKGTALLKLTEWLNIDIKDAIVFGNGDNDIPMFDLAGLAIAMGNSHEDVKKRADIIAPSNDEEGVAWAINFVMQKIQGE